MFATLENALTVATQAYWFSTKAINNLSNGSSIINSDRMFAHLQTLICTDIYSLATTGLFLLRMVIVVTGLLGGDGGKDGFILYVTDHVCFRLDYAEPARQVNLQSAKLFI